MTIAILTGQVSLVDAIFLAGAGLIGLVSWRFKRGSFWKEQAEEQRARGDRYAEENAKLHKRTDITPILESQERVTKALERSTAAMDETVNKLAEMNGSVKANTVALQALAERLILEESARGLLAAAAEPKFTPRRRRTP